MLLIALSTIALAQELEAPPIVGGETTSDFLPVGVFTIGYIQGGSLYYDAGSYWCSGTLISATWALTAAHCLDGFNLNQYNNAGYELLFCTGADLESGDLYDCGRISKLIIHEGYDSRYVTNDVGVVELEDDMSSSGSYALNTDRPNALSSTVTYVGWGSSTRYQGSGGGIKRTVDLPLIDYDTQNLTTYGENQNICSGDSGGAALQRDGGEWELVGVNSTVASYNGEDSCSGSQVIGNSMRVDVFYDWIAANADLDSTGTGNNGGGNNNGGGGNNNGGGDDTDDPEDTGFADTASPDTGATGGGGGKKKNNGNNKDESLALCSSVPLQTGGLMGLVMLGAALVGRRRD